MSEKTRKKKDGENRDTESVRAETNAIDRKQNTDQPSVKEPRTGDTFAADLERDSKQTKRGRSSEKAS